MGEDIRMMRLLSALSRARIFPMFLGRVRKFVSPESSSASMMFWVELTLLHKLVALAASDDILRVLKDSELAIDLFICPVSIKQITKQSQHTPKKTHAKEKGGRQ